DLPRLRAPESIGIPDQGFQRHAVCLKHVAGDSDTEPAGAGSIWGWPYARHIKLLRRSDCRWVGGALRSTLRQEDGEQREKQRTAVLSRHDHRLARIINLCMANLASGFFKVIGPAFQRAQERLIGEGILKECRGCP